jgi:DNA-directed RNA polymerase specialized sigma24 family protein
VSDRDATLAWLATDDAVVAARRLVRRYSLQIEPEDLVSQTRITLLERMSRRTAPLVGDDVQKAAIRFAARCMGNVAIDNARKMVRDQRQQVELANLLPQRASTEDHVEAAVFIEQLTSRVNDLVREGSTCPGCQKEVVFAAATEVLQLVLIEGASGDDATRDNAWFDDAIESVIDRTSPGSSQLASARRKRRVRCKHCVMELLGSALSRMGYRRG